MLFNKKALHALFASTLLGTSLSAIDLQGIAEFKYAIADAKAQSYLNTASDTTHAPHLSVGALFNAYNTRILLNYKPIRWEDADADLVSLSLDYVFKASQNVDLYTGAGLGSMSFKAQGLKDRKTVYTLQAGLNYSITDSFYAIAGINYLHTNDLGIQKNQFIYSNVENMLSAEVGIGFRFGHIEKTAPVQEVHAQVDKIEMPPREEEEAIAAEAVAQETVAEEEIAEEEVAEQTEALEQTTENAEQTIQAVHAPKKAIVQSRSLHVRPTPSTRNPPIAWLQKNQIIEIESCTESWCRLVDSKGFVSEHFIQIEAPVK